VSLTQQQIEERRKGIGGSDAAAILGQSRWRSPMDVYLDKIGATPAVDENEAMYWGSKLESAVFERFCDEHPELDARYQPHNASVFNGIMCALPDGLIYENDVPVAGLEIKTASAYKASEWDDDTPMEYYLQCQHYMAVFDLPKWYLAVLIGGQRYIEQVIERDQDVIDLLTEREAEFWQLVVDRTPPAVDGSDASENVLKYLYPADSVIEQAAILPETVEIEGEQVSVASLALMRVQLKDEIADAERRLKLVDNTFKSLLGENDRAYAGDFLVTWKGYTRSGIDTKRLQAERPEVAGEYIKATPYRKFDVKEAQHD
jgi:putative phage-type endonuclease